MRVLTRMWQMLLKALEEVAAAPNAMMAAEMAIIRLTHVADLPSPEELVRRLGDAPRRRRRPGGGGGGRRAGRAAAGGGGGAARRRRRWRRQPQPAPAPAPEPGPLARYATFEDVVALIRARRDMSLLVEIENGVRLVRYAPGRIEFEPADGGAAGSGGAAGAAAAALDRRALGRVGGGLGRRARRIAEARAARKGDLRARALEHPHGAGGAGGVSRARRSARCGRRTRRATRRRRRRRDEDDDDWDPFDPFSEE